MLELESKKVWKDPVVTILSVSEDTESANLYNADDGDGNDS